MVPIKTEITSKPDLKSIRTRPGICNLDFCLERPSRETRGKGWGVKSGVCHKKAAKLYFRSGLGLGLGLGHVIII